MTLQKDLAEVVRLMRAFEGMEGTAAQLDRAVGAASHAAYMLVNRHHAEIAQNAGAEKRLAGLEADVRAYAQEADTANKRLAALEKAMERVSTQVTFHTLTNRECVAQLLDAIRGTADEIMRERSTPEKAE